MKEGLTSDLTLRCRLSASATSGPVIGKRDVLNVGQYLTDVAEVTSIVVMKDGKDVASVSHVGPAHLMTSDGNIQVSGSIKATASELGMYHPHCLRARYVSSSSLSQS